MKSPSSLLSRLQLLTDEITTYETSRIANLKRLKELFSECVLDESYSSIEELFEFKAMNLMGITLSEDALGEIQEGRYIQLIVIAAKQKEEKKSTSISLSYFGRSEQLKPELVKKLTEFVLRWRYEKSFYQMNHYKHLLEIL